MAKTGSRFVALLRGINVGGKSPRFGTNGARGSSRRPGSSRHPQGLGQRGPVSCRQVLGVVLEDLDFEGAGVALENTAMEVNPHWGGSGFGGGSGPGAVKPFPSLFVSVRIIDPNANGGQQGVIIAFTTCLDGCEAVDEFGELPPIGTESMVRILVKSPGDAGVPDNGHSGCLRVVEDIVAAAGGVPLDSIFTVFGQALRACNLEQVELTMNFSVGSSAHRLSSDFNGDGRFDIADGLSLLNFLFAGGRPDPCYIEAFPDLTPFGRSVLDFDGNGSVTIADPIAALNRLFAGGAPHVLGGDCVAFDSTNGCASTCQDL